MKSTIFSILAAILFFTSCKKEELTPSWKEILTGSEAWTGTRFLVNGEDLMVHRDSSEFVYLSLFVFRFADKDAMNLRMIFKNNKGVMDPGEIPMTWNIKETTASIVLKDIGRTDSTGTGLGGTYNLIKANNNEIIMIGLNEENYEYEIHLKNN